MKVVHEPTNAATDISLDQDRYSAFLKEHGATEKQIALLHIHFTRYCRSDEFASRVIGGQFLTEKSTYKISVSLFCIRSSRGVNATLLHETKHFLQRCQGESHVEERKKPYYERQYEKDAYKFAADHRDKGFITLHRHVPAWVRLLWTVSMYL